MNIVDKQGRIQVASAASEWVHLALTKTSTQSLASGAMVAVNWQAVTASRGMVVGDWWSSSTNPNRITVPTGFAGLYQVDTTVQHSLSNAGYNRTVNLYTNGTTLLGGSTGPPRTNALAVKQVVGSSVWLNSGDYIDVQVYQDSGSTLTVEAQSHITISRYPLGVPMGTSSDEMVYVEADKDGDGDKDPLTSTSWNGGTKNGTGTINWNTDFGVPADAKAVVAQVTVKDVSSQQFLGFQAQSTTTNYSCWVYTTANMYVDSCMTIPVAADGTSYWAATSNLDNVYVRVIGWYVERPRQT